MTETQWILFVCLVVYVAVCFGKIAAKHGRNPVLYGILSVISPVNLIILGYWAFSKGPRCDREWNGQNRLGILSNLEWLKAEVMARHLIPDHPGQFRVKIARAGNYIVLNDKTGKNQVIIPCCNKSHAEKICARLNRGDHKGEIRA